MRSRSLRRDARRRNVSGQGLAGRINRINAAIGLDELSPDLEVGICTTDSLDQWEYLRFWWRRIEQHFKAFAFRRLSDKLMVSPFLNSNSNKQAERVAGTSQLGARERLSTPRTTFKR